MKIKYLFITLTVCFLSLCNAKKESLSADRDSVNTDLEKLLDLTPSEFMTQRLHTFFAKNYAEVSTRIIDSIDNTAYHDVQATIFKTSLKRYITEEYNTVDYADRLSRDGSHFVEFLHLSDELNFDTQAIYTCLRLLFNKIKWCQIIDYTVVEQVITPMPNLLKRYFEQFKTQTDTDRLTKKFELIMLNKFTNHLDLFQTESETFLAELAIQLANQVQIKQDQAIKISKNSMTERLRLIVKQTIEIMLSKTMWDPNAYQHIIPSFITIGNGIVELADKGILSHMDDVDDLLTSLNKQLCYFFDLYGSVLPVELYTHIMSDITNQVIFFLEFEEQDEGMTPKKETLIQHVIAAKAKAIALETKGMHSDQVV